MAAPQPPFDPFDPCYAGPVPARASGAGGRDDRADRPARAHAVVVGAGLGGLTAAVALRRQVERVTVVERDALPEMPAAGWMQPSAGRRRTMVSASRDLTEFAVRRRVLATRGISLRSGVEAAGLAVDTHRVIGVDLRARGALPGDPTERLAADLVVDASGRRSPAPDWLDAAGYGRPRETLIDAEPGYASRIYRRTRDEVGPGFKAIFLQAKPPHTTRMGSASPSRATAGCSRWPAPTPTSRPPTRRASPPSPAACGRPTSPTPSPG